MTKFTFDQITKDQIDANKLGRREFLMFHYFNPLGAVKVKDELNQRINRLVDAGAVKSGWILAYGSMNDYHERQIARLVTRKSKPSWRDASYHVRQLITETARIELLVLEQEERHSQAT